MKVLPLGALLVCLFAGPARADLQYAFNVTSISGDLQPFSFSFTSATFLAENDVPTFTPFTITNGVDSWKLTDGLITQSPSGSGCFEFATPTGFLNSGCSVGSDGSTQSAALFLELDVPLPTATGFYNIQAGNLLWDSSFVFDLTGSLDITSLATVPEPASVGLFVMVLALVGWKLNRRYAHSHSGGRL